MKMAAKTSNLDNNSPYGQMAQNSMHPSEVANVILRAVTSDNADFRYTVGKDQPCLWKQEEICPTRNLRI